MAAWRAMETTTTRTTNANVVNVEHKLGLFSAWERGEERESVTIKTKTNVELFCFALQVKTKSGGRGDKAEA